MKVKQSDRLDLIGDVDEKSGKKTLKRVLLYQVLNELSKTKKPKCVLVVWKTGLFEEDSYRK